MSIAGGVEAKVIMSIDAVGPRTAATAIVTSDGRVLHNEDIPCQLSASQRSQAVTKMGELIHHHHVDLIVISNGPARRATMIALGDLIKQSPEKSIRWTLADRSGADAYSSSSVANQEMRSTPRRFRAAAWLAFSVVHPAQAITKVDPLKLRLGSFQREISDEAILDALEDVLISGASRGGVDANAAPVSWLARLPGMTDSIAQAIDRTRRESLFPSRESIAELEQWESVVQSRQAIPFLRVFGSSEVLDGTLVHPDDYPLARKLAKSLEIELPPDSPPGYDPPSFEAESKPAEPAALTESVTDEEPTKVEEFTTAGEQAPDFDVAATAPESAEPSDTVATETATNPDSSSLETVEAADQTTTQPDVESQQTDEPEQAPADVQPENADPDNQPASDTTESSAKGDSDTSAIAPPELSRSCKTPAS